jgi:lycopene cyclase domain-containing protein
LNTHYTYFIILLCSIAGPLLLSFDKKVSFYKKWKYVFPAMVLPAILYILWDIFFTQQGVWSFNEAYITGFKLVNLPIEEVLFFFIIPYCCLFVYECVRAYFPLFYDSRNADTILKILAGVLFVVGIYFHSKYYTSWTFILNAMFIAAIYLFRKYFKDFDAFAFLIAYMICLLPFLVVNGFLTSIPVVLYNDSENLGGRIFTIPFEDTFYGMLLVLMNVSLFERFRNSKKG